MICSHCGSRFLLQRIPCLVVSLQVTPNKRSNISADILIKTVITNLLLDMVLQRAARRQTPNVRVTVSSHTGADSE
jgi:hypothetical protein